MAVQVVLVVRAKGALQLAGVQPAKVEPVAAVAVGVTVVLYGNVPLPPTVPFPVPVLLTVRV